MSHSSRSLRPALLWFFGTALVLLTGCLTIEENYTFKKNGSGSMEFVIDMSEFAEMLKALDDSKSKGDGDVSDTEMDMSDEVAALKGIKGISKVKVTERNWVQKLTFNFSDLAALNNALNVILPDSTETAKEFFRWEGNTLVRVNNRHAAELGGGFAEEGDSMDLSGMLESMKYRYSFVFPDPIVSTDVAEGVNKENDGTKQVNVSTDFSVIMKDPEALDLRITLDK